MVAAALLIASSLAFATTSNRKSGPTAPMIALLVKVPRVPNAEAVRAAATTAFGHPPESVECKGTDCVVRTGGFSYVVAFDKGFRNLEPALLAEYALRVAHFEHRGGVTVFCTSGPDEASREVAYAQVGRFAAALADADTLVVVGEEGQGAALPTPEILARLRAGEAEAALALAPSGIAWLVPNDSEMAAAMAEARRRLPEFLEFFRLNPEKEFLVKRAFTDGERTEYMWVVPVAVQNETFHGVLVSDPFEVRGFESGDDVEVPFSEVADWGYAAKSGNFEAGMFTQTVAQKRQ